MDVDVHVNLDVEVDVDVDVDIDLDVAGPVLLFSELREMIKLICECKEAPEAFNGGSE